MIREILKKIFVLYRNNVIPIWQRLIASIRKFLLVNRFIEVSCIFASTLAAISMAITSCQSNQISRNLADLTNESVKISEKLANQDLTRMKAELRPYLIIELAPGIKECLKKDGNSQLFFDRLENTHLILPFKIRNVGKIPAINIKAKYVSPTQEFIFPLGERAHYISPDAEAPETFRPAVNISSILNNKEGEDFKIDLEITYEGYNEIDPRIYSSTLELMLAKRGQSGVAVIHDIKESNFKFGFK